MVKGKTLFWTWAGMRKACMKKSYPSTRKAPFFSASECRKAGMREYVQVRGKGGMHYLKYTSGSARWMKRPYSKYAEEGRKISTRKKRSSKKKRSSRRKKRLSKKKKSSSRRKKRLSKKKKSSSKRKKRSSKRRKRLTSKQRRYGRRGAVKTTAIYKRTKSGGYRLSARAAYNAGYELGSERLLLNGKRKCLKLNSNGSPFWGAC